MVNDSTSYGFGVAGTLDRAVVRKISARLEAEGFRTLWVNDTPEGDSLAALAAAAEVTAHLRLGTGVISIDRRSPIEIIRAVRDLHLPEDRLVIGIGGAAQPTPLLRVEASLGTLRAGLRCRLMVGALGPRMRRLGAQKSDGVLLNWLTPTAARQAATDRSRDANAVHRRDVEACLYVRTALGPEATRRMEQEAARYQEIASYAANFERMGVTATETTVGGESPDEIRAGLQRYDGILDEIVVRAITSHDAANEYLEVISALVSQPFGSVARSFSRLEPSS